MQIEVARLIAGIHADGVAILLVEQNAAMALDLADHAYVLESGKVVLHGPAARLRADHHVRELYLGIGGDGARSYRDVKHHRLRLRGTA
jgi:branched-chain amino acid transport system ATP-binding protein